jgi:hypothetical protein
LISYCGRCNFDEPLGPMFSFAPPPPLKLNLWGRIFLLRFFLITSETGLKPCSNLETLNFKLG